MVSESDASSHVRGTGAVSAACVAAGGYSADWDRAVRRSQGQNARYCIHTSSSLGWRPRPQCRGRPRPRRGRAARLTGQRCNGRSRSASLWRRWRRVATKSGAGACRLAGGVRRRGAAAGGSAAHVSRPSGASHRPPPPMGSSEVTSLNGDVFDYRALCF